MYFSPVKNLYHVSFNFFEDQFLKSLTAQQKKVTCIALTIFSLLATAALVYRYCFSAKKESIQKDKQVVNEEADISDELLDEKQEKMTPIKIFFVTCNPGPAAHFAAIGKALDAKYEVSFIAAGAGLAKLKDSEVKVIDFNPQQLDLTTEEIQVSLAKEVATTCSVAHFVIADVGHQFSVHLQKALNECQNTDELPIFASYYDNTEKWVPGGYSKMASEVTKISRAVFFANHQLAHYWPYQDETTPMDLKGIACIGVGYYPLEQAEKLRQERLTKQVKARHDFLESLKIEDKGQKILVYLGENNTDYFDKSLPKFIEFLEESIQERDLSNLIILFQLHPNAKVRQIEEKLLAEKELYKNPKAPLCILSKLNSNEALVLADAVAGRQSSMVSQIALANIPYMQVGHAAYPDVLVRNHLCSVATTTSDFLNNLDQVFNLASEDSKTKKKVLQGLGIRENWVQNFDQGLKILLKAQQFNQEILSILKETEPT